MANQQLINEITAKYAAKWAKETNSKLQLRALRAFPSSPFQLAIRQELNRRLEARVEQEENERKESIALYNAQS